MTFAHASWYRHRRRGRCWCCLRSTTRSAICTMVLAARGLGDVHSSTSECIFGSMMEPPYAPPLSLSSSTLDWKELSLQRA